VRSVSGIMRATPGFGRGLMSFELEEVSTLLRHEDIATSSNLYGGLGMKAKRRIQQRLVEFVREQANTEQAVRREVAWNQSPASVQ
jgi:hypothetical protein